MKAPSLEDFLYNICLWSYLIAIVCSDASFNFSVNPKLVFPDVATHVQQDGLELEPDLLRTVGRSVGLTRNYRNKLFNSATEIIEHLAVLFRSLFPSIQNNLELTTCMVNVKLQKYKHSFEVIFVFSILGDLKLFSSFRHFQINLISLSNPNK